MRTPLAIAVFFAGLTGGTAAARAADLPLRLAERGPGYEIELGRPAGQILIYDYEPGVVLRPWWLPPWRDRHYFPFGAARPAAFRPVRRLPPQRAERFERSWSTCSLCDSEAPRAIGRPLNERPPLLLPLPDRTQP
ncbi:MAG TPA: hypothetical protein VFT69_00385 [Pseudolabrys sp.]|jgi:hypothetical protein|nr:hypothetical protein [Pseudolabrys sp.]